MLDDGTARNCDCDVNKPRRTGHDIRDSVTRSVKWQSGRAFRCIFYRNSGFRRLSLKRKCKGNWLKCQIYAVMFALGNVVSQQ